jgi:hypothetical protein
MPQVYLSTCASCQHILNTHWQPQIQECLFAANLLTQVQDLTQYVVTKQGNIATASLVGKGIKTSQHHHASDYC